jgi:chaperone modulatory protein CbpM
MNTTAHETCIVEEHLELGVDELGRVCRCSRESIVTLVHEGVLQPTDPAASDWRFAGENLRRAHRATRLQRDFDLDAAAVALVLQLLDRIDELERRLR